MVDVNTTDLDTKTTDLDTNTTDLDTTDIIIMEIAEETAMAEASVEQEEVIITTPLNDASVPEVIPEMISETLPETVTEVASDDASAPETLPETVPEIVPEITPETANETDAVSSGNNGGQDEDGSLPTMLSEGEPRTAEPAGVQVNLNDELFLTPSTPVLQSQAPLTPVQEDVLEEEESKDAEALKDLDDLLSDTKEPDPIKDDEDDNDLSTVKNSTRTSAEG